MTTKLFTSLAILGLAVQAEETLTFHAPCRTVFRKAAAAARPDGWQLRTSDFAGGVMSFVSTRPRIEGFLAVKEALRNYTQFSYKLNYPDFLDIGGMTVTFDDVQLPSADDGCKVTSSVDFLYGHEVQSSQRTNGIPIASNGSLEKRFFYVVATALRN